MRPYMAMLSYESAFAQAGAAVGPRASFWLLLAVCFPWLHRQVGHRVARVRDPETEEQQRHGGDQEQSPDLTVGQAGGADKQRCIRRHRQNGVPHPVLEDRKSV